MVDAAVIGATGYGGVELVRLLRGHPQVRLAYLSSETYAGKRLAEVYPHLVGMDDELRSLEAEAVARECQVALLAVPAGTSLEVTPRLLAAGLRVVDVSPDFRLRDPGAYAQWYGREHTSPELLAEAAFGLPEWYREAIAGARLVAAPGCYTTAAVLALAPLVADGLIEASDIIVDGKTGVSGAGRTSLRVEYHFPEANGDAAPYGVGGHRHLPEMLQALADVGAEGARVTFVPHLLPMTRGILMTVYARPAAGAGAEVVREALRRRYQEERFVHVLPEGLWPHTKLTSGTNHCFLGVGQDRATGRLVVAAALDNLGKGMAGQMVQCLNLMLGLDEETGIGQPAAYP